MNTGKLTYIIRIIGLMHFFDLVKYRYQWLKNYSANKKFKKGNPSVILPPDYMMFESFRVNYKKYYEGGREVASWIVSQLTAFDDLKNAAILDWGCGPARVIRHLPQILPSCSCTGTDYNPATIEWCKKNIPGIQFSLNQLNPPLSFAADTFSAAYGISIFTHLSEESHYGWYNELIRVLKKGGLLLLTTHGEAYKAIMTDPEKALFDKGDLVIRANVKEGHRVFAAFHPVPFVKNLFETKAVVLKHIPGRPKEWGIDQDVWILKKL